LIFEITVAIGLILFVFYSGYFLLMWLKSKDLKSLGARNDPGVGDSALSVSVVVPTYNEEDTIVYKLKNLMEQDYPGMEIIVVDGASKDQTVKLIKNFVKNNDFEVKLITEDERNGKASALNKAFKQCSGQVVVMTDADAIWDKDTLSKALSNFSDPQVGAVTGRQILLNPNQSLATKIEKSYRNVYEVLRVGESAMDSTPIFHGEISCFRRSLVENVSEDSMADDSELAVKIRKKGFRSIYDPNAVFYEHAPPTFKSRLTQKLRRGQGLIQMFLRERGILFNQKYKKFGLFVFPAEFFMHVISPTLMFAFLILFIYALFSIDNYITISLSFAAAIPTAVLIVMKRHIVNLPLSFLNSQFILLLSLICQILGKSQHKWAKVTAVRRLWRKEAHSAVKFR
jgi:cellulose synthase/poly-beta-1,6-N-acetylglucosamine synthase-like glycosyltransferase